MPAPVSLKDAVRDTVTVESRNPDNRKLGRSQTANATPSKNPPPNRRSHSEDSVEKPKSKAKAKKGSQHADVIDRLDFTGVGPMFHHDGPFDACAPSRNRHKTKAPMMAWTPQAEGESQLQYNDNPYPSSHAMKAFSSDSTYEPPKKKVDAIAEAWGIHEPEPYEEFFAGGGNRGDTPASSIYNGKESHAPPVPRRRNRAGGERRSVLPPPQPIFTSDALSDEPLPSGAGSPGFKRTKSLMHRIRKMRDSPNVPVAPGDYDDTPPSPSSAHHPTDQETAQTPRPTHRPQNSFLGRFGGGNGGSRSAGADNEAFVYIDATTNKDLPATPPVRTTKAATPGENPSSGYFDEKNSSGSSSPPNGVGRKTSIMKKMGRVVKGR